MSVLSGPEKAVLFLLSLDEEVATPILRELADSDVRKLRSVASTMRGVSVGALEEVHKEFVERASVAVAVPRGGLSYLRALSGHALGEERTRNVFEEGVTSPFSKLEVAPPESVAPLLANEPPQVSGAILARMAPQAAAAILALIPEERQAAIVMHVSRMTEVEATILEDIANAIASELPPSDANTAVNIDGIARAAEILNAGGKDYSNGILTNLDTQDEALANEIRQAMFTFDDLASVDKRAVRELLREIPTERLTLALKDASEAVMSAIFAGLSSRAADLIRDDLEVLTSVKRSEVEAARRELVAAALRLEAEGRIDLGRGND